MHKRSRLHPLFRSALNAVGDIFSVWQFELRLMFRDAGAITFFVLLPLAYPLIYAYIYNNEAAREVPMVVVDRSKSSLSREFIRKVDAAAEVSVVGYCNDLSEGKEAVWSGNAFGILVIPEDFSRKLEYTHEQSPVLLYSDMSGLLLYKAMLISLTEASIDLGKEIEAANLPPSTTEREKATTLRAMLASEVSMFNPKAGFGSFLIPAIMILLIQQALLLGVGMMVGTSKEVGGPIVHLDLSKHLALGALRVVVGKALTYFMMFALSSVWLLRVIPRIFNFPMVGNPEDIALFVLPYLLACVFFAITATAVVRDRESSFVIFVFTSVPLLFISGISWPESALPEGWRYFSYLFPSTFGIQGFVRMNTSGATLADVGFQYLGLWVQALFYFLTAVLSFGLLLKERR